jgi:TRAP-type C4-dicarboxylate transport system permease small subunit
MDQTLQPESQLNPVVKWICNVMIAISAGALVIMLFISVADVIGRSFFLHPIQGTSELVGMLLVITSALGFGYCQLMKGNVNIDIFVKRFSRRGQGVLNIISNLMSLAVCVIIAWKGMAMVLQYSSEKLGSTSATLGILLWPFMLIMSLGFAWVGVIFIIDLYNAFLVVFKR